MTSIFDNKRKFNNAENVNDYSKTAEKSRVAEKSSIKTNFLQQIESAPYDTQFFKITKNLNIFRFYDLQDFIIDDILYWNKNIRTSITKSQKSILLISSPISLYLSRSKNFVDYCIISEDLQINVDGQTVGLLFLSKGIYYIMSDYCEKGNYLQINIV